MKALVDLTLLFMLRNMPNERDALAWTEHFHRQLDLGVKAVFSQRDGPSTKQ
ncbi:hypothetical protein [Chelativorans salis]|uniref:Uncharacterized protein n=1 Tax=Chelativorans salis TaxID=2978478 RepID=A0ABT2LQ05_9HYPH|nr:hypothetical protein [Chelativorans sp. EGI FJ00035]MCT7375468.1 hypothetical protein [Chelativorans sp. EGI FJ00035]